MTVNIANITFTNANSGTNGCGGALFNQGNLTVTNCIFTNNIANWGGAIGNNGGNLTFSNSTFQNNSVTHDGGAIDNMGTATLSVDTSSFLNNTATNAGGAIMNWQSTMTLTESNFSGNTAGWQGNAIGNYYDNATINYNRLVGNGVANGAYQLYNGYGGTVNATDNWWGSNSDPTTVTGNIYNSLGSVTSNPWLVLNVSSSCDRSNSNGTIYNYIVTADTTHDNNGNDTSPNGNIPDDIPLYFNTTLGLISTPVSTQNGKAVATLTNTSAGTANVSVTLDNQTDTIPITVMSNIGGVYNNRTGEYFMILYFLLIVIRITLL